MENPEAKPEKVTKPKANGKADLGKRFLAALIDGVLSGIVSAIIPFVGGLIGAAYMLLRDGFEFDFMDHRSLGKKLLKLRPVTLDGTPVDINVSIKRNWVFAVPLVLMVIPILGWVLAPIIGVVIGIIECVLVLTDPEGRRWGDKFANTKVIEVSD